MTLEEAEAKLRDVVAEIRAAGIHVDDGSCGCCGGSEIYLGTSPRWEGPDTEHVYVNFWESTPLEYDPELDGP